MKISLHKLKWKILKKMKNSKGIFFHLTGLICLIWFLIRVLPKPDRVRYPCQQMSLTIATGYIAFWAILWGSLFFGLGLWIKKVKYKTAAYAPVFIVLLVLVFSVTSNVYAINLVKNKKNFESWDTIPNQPIGVPIGLNPGRVVWVWNPDATVENLNGYWWKEENNNQKIINKMLSDGIKNLAGFSDEKESWDLLFKYFNTQKGKGELIYQPGEKIAIKVNLNNCWQTLSYIKTDNERDASPYVVKALLYQLTDVVGVNQEDITIYDASRPMANWFYNRVYYKSYPSLNLEPEFSDINYKDSKGLALGRQKVQPSNEKIYFSEGSCEYRTIPKCVVEADYLINIPILKRHPIQDGVTLSAKNYFGSWIEEVFPIHPYHQSGLIMGNAAPQVDLLSYEHLGGKTLLYLGDGTYATKIDHSTIGKFLMEPFNNDWTNSLFFSQDPIAIDSVMFDFLHTEGTNPIKGSQNYMHQGAEPIENKYDPENDGIFLNHSLGVHEHWNKSVDIFSSDRYIEIDYVTVKPEEEKSVKIIKPKENFLYINNNEFFNIKSTIVFGEVLVKTNINEVNAEIEKVEFIIDEVIIEEVYNPPYECYWNQPTNDQFELKVKVYFDDFDVLSDEMKILKII